MKRITKRDVLFFFIGIATFLILDSIYNWEETLEAFRKGNQDGQNAAKF